MIERINDFVRITFVILLAETKEIGILHPPYLKKKN